MFYTEKLTPRDDFRRYFFHLFDSWKRLYLFNFSDRYLSVKIVIFSWILFKAEICVLASYITNKPQYSKSGNIVQSITNIWNQCFLKKNSSTRRSPLQKHSLTKLKKIIKNFSFEGISATSWNYTFL